MQSNVTSLVIKTGMATKVRLLFFGKARDLVDKSECEIEVPSASLSCKQLEKLVFQQLFPQLDSIARNCLLAVDQRYCKDPDELLRLNEHSEIAVIPPLSGG